MSIIETTMYGVICDCCQKQLEVHNKVSYWTDEGRAEEVAMEMDWIFNEEGDPYCPQCATLDKDGRIILDESRRNQFEESINAGDPGDLIGQEDNSKPPYNLKKIKSTVVAEEDGEPEHPTPEQDEAYYNHLQDGIDMLKFSEWCGDNYVRLATVWVHRFHNQHDSNNWLTTEQLLEMYKSPKS